MGPGSRRRALVPKRWLRADLVAGLVLAAILVPQGMAYAELAGLPAVTGLYTTIACLVGYAIFGPSRVLVLGPDSSVSPLIFAAITPLLVPRRPGERGRARRDAGAARRRSSRSALGLGKLGFVADLLSSEVQVGYMNGLAITIIVGQLPKLFGFSTDADGFVDEVARSSTHLDATQAAALAVGVGGARRAAGAASDHAAHPRGARRGRRRHDRVGGARSRGRRRRDGRDAAAGRSRRRRCRGRRSTTSGRSSSRPSASCSCRSPTPSPPRRASRRGAATSCSPTRR